MSQGKPEYQTVQKPLEQDSIPHLGPSPNLFFSFVLVIPLTGERWQTEFKERLYS